MKKNNICLFIASFMLLWVFFTYSNLSIQPFSSISFAATSYTGDINIQHCFDNGYQKIFITTSQSVSYKPIKLTSPSRLVLDIQRNASPCGHKKIEINNPLIQSIRYSQYTNSTFRIVIDLASDNFSYKITENEGKLCIQIPYLSNLTDKLVVIDSGHGGVDSGAVSGEYYEKDFNLDIATQLNKILQSSNIKTYMTRTEDKFVDLQTRVDIANNLKASLFISIHNNASTSLDSHGTETLYVSSPQTGSPSKKLAQIVQNYLINDLGTTNRGIVERQNLKVLNSTYMPAIITEIGFITNPNDLKLLQSPNFRQKAAAALAKAIIQALSEL